MENFNASSTVFQLRRRPAVNEPFERAVVRADELRRKAPSVALAIEDFAQELAHITRRFLRTKAWDKTERIMVGGGFRDSRQSIAVAPLER